jgi:hypothetical protein
MEQEKNKRLVLTSVNQVLTLVRSNPAIADYVPKLSQLKTLPQSTAPQKACNCGAKKNITTPDTNKQIAENALTTLTSEDFQAIKSVLGLNELCYYKRNLADSTLQLICV